MQHGLTYRAPSLKSRLYKYRWLYLFLLPAIIWYVIFAYGPIYGLQIAFKDFKILKGIEGSEWVGLKHFIKMFETKAFWQATRNTLVISLLKLVFVSTSGLGLALLLNEVTHHWVIASDMWESAGWNTIIFIAAIGGISPELYEAAQIDGAGRWKQLTNVTLPCIAGTIVVVMVLKVGSMMNAGFDQIYNMYNSAVMDTADILDTYVYRQGIESSKFSYSTAVGLFKNVINLILVLATNYFAKVIGQEGLF